MASAMTAVSSARPGAIQRIWGSAPLLLSFTVLIWAGNSVVGRAAAPVVPPMALTFCRWSIALLAVAPLAWPHLRRDWPEIRRRWRILLLLGLTGLAGFPTFLYWGLQYTTALNSVLLQAAIPPLVLLCSFLLFRERATGGQLAGVGLSLVGVLVIIAQGRPWMLLHLGPNIGDAAILFGILLYAVYPPLLRQRPPIHPLSLLACLFAVGAVATFPLFLIELASGRTIAAGPGAFAAIAYVSLAASVTAYLCFNRGVELIGAGRAGQYVHLMPVFGAVLAVALLHERLHLFHLAGVALIAGGIGLSALGRRAAPAAEAAGG